MSNPMKVVNLYCSMTHGENTRRKEMRISLPVVGCIQRAGQRQRTSYYESSVGLFSLQRHIAACKHFVETRSIGKR